MPLLRLATLLKVWLTLTNSHYRRQPNWTKSVEKRQPLIYQLPLRQLYWIQFSNRTESVEKRQLLNKQATQLSSVAKHNRGISFTMVTSQLFAKISKFFTFWEHCFFEFVESIFLLPNLFLVVRRFRQSWKTL